MKRASIIIIAALSFARVASGQGNPLGGDPDAELRNVGVLGILGDGSKTSLEVKKVLPGPAQDAGVRAGDEVVSVDGRAFDQDPVLSIVAAVDAAEGAKKGTVALGVKRDGKETVVKVTIASLGKHSPTCPKKCDKCKKIAQHGVDWLAEHQGADGCFPTELGGKTGKVVVTSLAGLAMLSAGAPPEGPLSKSNDWVMGHCDGKEDGFGAGRLTGGGAGGGGNWNQTNWELAYGSIFLSEVAKRTKRADVRAKLDEVVKLLVKNQEQSGGWAHGPGGPNALGYLELEILLNWSLMGIGCAKRCGVETDGKPIEKALDWIEQTSNGDGGVGYSPREGQKGYGEAGRTSGAIVAYSLLGERRRPFFEKMAGFYRGHVKTLETGHVSPCMHLLTGALASAHLGAKDQQDYMDTYRLAIMAARRPNGSFAPTPTHESQALHSNTDAQVGPCWTTATYVLILSLPNEKVPVLLGKTAPEKGAKEAPGRTATGAGR